MPVSEVISGAVLGLALQVLRGAIKNAKNRSSTARCILDRLDATIFRITPFVVQVDKLSEEVEGSPRKIVEDLKLLLEKAVSLVEAYAELRRRNLIKKYRYKRRIIELEASLRWMVDVDIQVNQWADIKELMAKMSEMNTKLDKITCKPTDCFKSKYSVSQSSNQHSFEARDPSSEERAECLSDESKPKIDIHIQWSSRKRNKDRDIRFTFK